MDRLLENLKEGRPSFGVLIKGDIHMVDHMAKAGVAYVKIDMMFSQIDWSEAASLIRGAKVHGVFPFLRIQSYPWASTQTDGRLVVDAARALSIGAKGILFSPRNAEEVEQVVHVQGDWHRGLPILGAQELAAHEKAIAAETIVMPMIECRQALAEIDQILSVKGLKAVNIGFTDLSEQLGHPYEYDHPELWEKADQIIKLAKERGINIICGNDGFQFFDLESKAQRLQRLWEHGVNLLHMQTTEWLAFMSAKSAIDRAKNLIAASSR